MDMRVGAEVQQRETERIHAAYEKRFSTRPSDYYHLSNPAALFLLQEIERNFIRSLREHHAFPLTQKRVLDVGCGKGFLLRSMVRWGAEPENLTGVDLLPELVEEASRLNPNIRFLQAEASQLPFENESFDLVTQFTVLSSVVDRGLRTRIASEMLRVTKPGGSVISFDMRITRYRDKDVVPIDGSELSRLFGPNRIQARSCGLAPPIVHRVAARSHVLCHLLSVMPMLRTHYMSVVIKDAPSAS